MEVKPEVLSSGTLRIQDLAPTFFTYLERLKPEVVGNLRKTYGDIIEAKFDHAQQVVSQHSEEHFYELADEFLHTVIDLINLWLPERYMLTATEGDAACFVIMDLSHAEQ